jgi:hypothetical protein
MNLNQITARIGELSAELLTLHNDLAHLVEGTVSRQSVRAIRTFKDFREGDKVVLQSISHADMLSYCDEFKVGDVCTVCDIETLEYEGRYNVLIETESGDTACWVNYTILELVV